MAYPATSIVQTVVDPEIQRWDNFVEKLNEQSAKVPEPYEPVKTLAMKYLHAKGKVLDIGCETGKNAIPLIEAGHTVTLLDIAPAAIRISQENIKKLGLEKGIGDSVVGKIEDLDPKYGPFDAVIGTYAFSFIPPGLFQKVMGDNVLGRVAPNGYFVGGFFGDNHSWAKDPTLSIMTEDKIKALLSANGFTVCDIQSSEKVTKTVLDGDKIFHTISVIAQQTLNPTTS